MSSLIIKGHNVQARLTGERIVLRKWDEVAKENRTQDVPLFDVDRVVIAGRPYVTVPVLAALMRRGIPVSFIDSDGRWLGNLSSVENGDVSRRLRQYELCRDTGLVLDVARHIVVRKLENNRRVLQRLSSYRQESEILEQRKVSSFLKRTIRQAESATDLDQVRGFEGVGSARYFSRLKDFFPAELPFERRSRRPPHNGANALLSWTYSIVLGEIESQCRQSGLEPCLGFLHEISYNRPSLALDLLEAYRGPLCDLLVLKIINHKILQAGDFEYRSDKGGVYLRTRARKPFFIEYERAMERLFTARKDEPHTTFRRSIGDDIRSVIRLLEDQDAEFSVFRMP